MAFAYQGSWLDAQAQLTFFEMPDLALAVDSQGIRLLAWLTKNKVEQLLAEDKPGSTFVVQGRQVVLVIPRTVTHKGTRSQEIAVVDVGSPHIIASGRFCAVNSDEANFGVKLEAARSVGPTVADFQLAYVNYALRDATVTPPVKLNRMTSAALWVDFLSKAWLTTTRWTRL
eukprot:888990-Amphidinium_carterae.2